MDLNKNNQNPHQISRRKFLGLAGIATAGLLASCQPNMIPLNLTKKSTSSTQQRVFRTPDFPLNGWRTATPEEQDIDSRGIIEMIKKIRESTPYVHSFLLIRNGAMVTEAYFAPINKDLDHFLFSATKSFTSAMVGVAIQEGYIQGVNQRVLDFFPEMRIKNPSENLEKLTIGHLLSMSSGHVNPVSPNPNQKTPVDWVEKFLGEKNNTLLYDPGSQFLYTSGAPHTLSAIIQKTTGKKLSKYTEEKLFRPLGIKDYSWLTDQNGITFGNSHLKLKPTDMAKFGYLYLNQGNWEGQSIIPKTWVQESIQKRIETKNVQINAAEQYGYGYLWWMNGFGGYSAHGYGGQYIFILPDLNLVAVFTGGYDDDVFDTSYKLMRDYIVPSIKSEIISENQNEAKTLKELVNLAGHPIKKAVPPLSDTARRISGKIYQLPDGTQINIRFDGSDEYFGKRIPASYKGKLNDIPEYRGGLDDIYRLNPNMDAVMGPSINGIKGVWADEKTFIETVFRTDNVSSYINTCTINGDVITIEVRDNFSGKSTFQETITATLVK